MAERRGGLVAFAPAPPRRPLGAQSRTPEAIVYGAAALVLAGALARRFRSRPLRLRRP